MARERDAKDALPPGIGARIAADQSCESDPTGSCASDCGCGSECGEGACASSCGCECSNE